MKRVNWNTDYGSLNITWAKIIADVRKESGLTRPDLSKLSGITVRTIKHYEHNEIVEPSIYKVEALLNAMGYDLDAIRSK